MSSSIEQLFEKVGLSVGSYLPTLILALGVLLAGWLIAWAVGLFVRKALHKTSLDNRVVAWLGGDQAKAREVEIEYWIGKGVFYLIMLFVLLAFFQILGLAAVSEPINRFLIEVFEFAPRLLGPAVLLLIAWVVASVLRYVLSQLLENAKVDERFADQTERETALPLSKTLSEAAYWLVFLLFLPAILGPLGLDGLLTPVQNLVDQLLGFLPQLLAASLILAVGWFVARILQRIVTSLLAAFGVDEFSEKMGLSAAFGKQTLSGLLGILVYVLILVPVLIASLDALKVESITTPASQMLNTVLGALPNIFAAALVLAIAYLVGRLVAGLVTNLLIALGFNVILERIGLKPGELENRKTPSEITGSLVLAGILLFAANESARLLGFDALGEIVTSFLFFAGRVALGLIIFGIGLYLANLASNTVRASGTPQAPLLAFISRLAVIVLSGAMSLRQMGLANEIINLAFGLTLGAIAAAVALAFGLGARDSAARQIEEWRQAWKAKDQGI